MAEPCVDPENPLATPHHTTEEDNTKTDKDQCLGKLISFQPAAVAPEGSILSLLLTLSSFCGRSPRGC